MSYNSRDLEWQRRYEENDTPWDKGSPAPALINFLREGQISGRVLVPGCGRGHDVRAIAAQPGAHVVGLDFAPAAVEGAGQLALSEGLGARAQFVLGDFFRLPPDMQNAFDWLVEHTCFCAIDPSQRRAYVGAAATALRKGGRIFAIFYLNPDVDEGPPFAVTKKELGELFDPHFALLREWVPRESFAGRENRELVQILQKR